MERELHSGVDDRVALDPQAITSDTTTIGNIIDVKGFESFEYLIHSREITDGAYTLKVEDGDDSGLSDAADVASELVLGALTGFIAADDNAVKRVGVISKKQFQRLSLVSTGTTSGGDSFGAIVVLGHPKHAPVSQ